MPSPKSDPVLHLTWMKKQISYLSFLSAQWTIHHFLDPISHHFSPGIRINSSMSDERTADGSILPVESDQTF